MNKYEIVKKIEAFAPLETQEKWDASGWIVELKNSEIKKIMFALTVTKDVVKQALEQGCDMIISHHPLFTVPIEFSKINIYCAHTNLDKANGGTTDLVLDKLGLKGIAENEFVRVVEFQNGISVDELKEKLKQISPKLRYINNLNKTSIKKACFCAGSGSEFIEMTNCDCFVTGDLKFHTAVETEKVVFDIGHFESEIFAKNLLKNITEVNEKGVFANEKSPFI